MADKLKATDGPHPFSAQAFDTQIIPEFDIDFISQDDLDRFEQALHAPESNSVTALNDWKPIHQRVRRKSSKPKKRSSSKPRRTKDETREGFVYTLLKWPFLFTVLAWIVGLGFAYLCTRFYVWAYEHLVTWRGRRETLRRKLASTSNYRDWIAAANELDVYLGNDKWKEIDSYAYYDAGTIKRAYEQLRTHREKATRKIDGTHPATERYRALEELKHLVETCTKNNFAGIENPRIYSETYYGTKDLAQNFIDELEACLRILLNSASLNENEKFILASHLHNNFGRTALCLSGGAAFAYYHFGVIKALLDASLLPDVITGTSGGALIAALVATRKDEELKNVLVPALARRITACEEPFRVWYHRWRTTGARFDSIAWARKCSWFTRGSLTFKEAYELTGRILNVTCVPSDPHSPSILANYLTAPNCVIWSAVLASAAVPGILNPIVLMMKKSDGTLAPYSFGHKWKDGSLRTDVPLRALNLHFNVNFSIVSQVNPHINLFFFSSRGTVGRPVTHRKGRGWRGGFLGSALEQYLKLDLTKWLKVLRHLELLPRPLGQDWSEVWLQNFSGTVTIWPQSIPSDFVRILSDPDPPTLARMIQVGQQSTFGKLLFIANRIKIERLIEHGLLMGGGKRNSLALPDGGSHRPGSMHVHGQEMRDARDDSNSGEDDTAVATPIRSRRSSGMVQELVRQSGVFFDDPPPSKDEEDDTEYYTEDTETSANEWEEANEVLSDGPTVVKASSRMFYP